MKCHEIKKNNRYYPENIENIFCKIKELKDLNFIDDNIKKELNLNSIELKKISELQAIINLKEKDFFSKEKKIIELEAKLNLTKIELENKDYIINRYKNNEVELQNKINELQNKLLELNKMGFLEKIKKIF